MAKFSELMGKASPGPLAWERCTIGPHRTSSNDVTHQNERYKHTNFLTVMTISIQEAKLSLG